MLQLHTMAPAYGLPTYTPFGLKVIAQLRLARVPFEIVIEHIPGRGPKKKFPWLVDGERVIADSGFIVEHLAEHHDADLDRPLTPAQRGQAHALRRMIEESLCFAISYTRWMDDDVCRQTLPTILASLPRPARALVAPLVRTRIRRDLWGQGIARHRAEEVTELGAADLCALASQLGERPYLMGAQVTSIDACAAAFLAVILYAPFDTGLRRALITLPNLVSYCDRMRALCFEANGEPESARAASAGGVPTRPAVDPS